ncbi:MAG: D-2-hydroxyacid dehydrogenase [Acidiferrobacterales bacterium]|nr:D-2-hydroxyacid dehydrogenase [Acidiferrobacterales bacterium]
MNLTPLLSCLDSWDHYDSTVHGDAAERITDAAVVITNKVRLDRQTILQAEHLKLVMLAATGTDNVDLAACKEKGVLVCNARQYSNAAVVQHTFALMLSLSTNLLAYHEDVRNGKWSQSPIFCLLDHPIRELENKTLGIVGYGNLGSSVAEVAKAFGMQVVICQRPNAAPSAGRLPLSEFLQSADFISIHAPLTADTKHLFSSAEFEQMKPDAVLINTARGAIVDVEALVTALQSGQIGGAGIDVLDQEPPENNYPLLGRDIPNLIVTPHTAWASVESRRRLVEQLTDNLKGWLAGEPRNIV